MARTIPAAARAFTAAATVVSTVFAPLAPLAPVVQAQGIPGTVRVRSCAVGADTLASLGVIGAGTVYVTDGAVTKAVAYDPATQSIASFASNVQSAMRSSAPIGGQLTALASGNAIGTTQSFNNDTAIYERNSTFFTTSLQQRTFGFVYLPNAVTLSDETLATADASKEPIRQIFGDPTSNTTGPGSRTLAAFASGPNSGQYPTDGVEFRGTADNYVVTGSELLTSLKASDRFTQGTSSPPNGRFDVSSGIMTITSPGANPARSITIGDWLYTTTNAIQIGSKVLGYSGSTSAPSTTGTFLISTGYSNTNYRVGLSPAGIYVYWNPRQTATFDGYRSLSGLTQSYFTISGNGETVYFKFDPTATAHVFFNMLANIMSFSSHISISGNPIIADIQGKLISNLGLDVRPSSSKPVGDATDVLSNGGWDDTVSAVYWDPMGPGSAYGSSSVLNNYVVGNVPITYDRATNSTIHTGSIRITNNYATQVVNWNGTNDTWAALEGKISSALAAASPAISSTGTADFGTSNTSKITIAASGKTLTLSDTNSGATGALAKLNLPTTATASPVVSTASIATSGGSCADTTPPTVSTITTTASGTKKVGDTVTITVTFSEAVTTTGTSSLLLETGSTDTAATCPAVTASTTLTCTYTVASGDTVTRLDVQSISALTGTIVDAAGNAYVAANGLPALGSSGLYGANLTVDGVVPVAPSTVSLAGPSDTGVSPSDGVTNQTSVTVTGTAEAGSTVALRDGGSPIGGATGTASGGGTFSITVTLAAGAHTLTATATDSAGNTSAASAPLAVTIDTTAPTVASIVRAGGATQATTGATAPSFTVTFSEAVSGLGAANFAVASGATIGGTAPTIASVTGSGTTWMVTLGAAGTTGDGSGTASLGLIVVPGGASVTDVAGNALASAAVAGANDTYLLTATAPAPSGGGSSPTDSTGGAASSGAPNAATPTPVPTAAPTVVTYASTPVPGADTVRVAASDGRLADLAHAVTDPVTGTRIVRSVVEAPTGDHYAVDANGRLEWLDPSRPETPAIVSGAVISRLPMAAIETLDIAPPAPGTVLWDASGISGHSLYGVGPDGVLHALPEGPVDPAKYRAGASIVPLLSIIQLARLPIGLPEGFDPAKAPPSVFAIERAYGAPEVADADRLTFTVIFSEPVTGADKESFRLAPGTGLVGRLPMITGVTGAGTTWRVAVDASGATGIGNATIGIEVVPPGIENAAGVALASGIPTDHEERFRLARTVPVVTDIIRASAAPELIGASALPLGATFTVVLSEAVTGISPTSFAVVNGAGIAGSTPVITSVEGSGTTWTVRVALDGVEGDYGADRSATIGLRVVPDASSVTGSAGGRLISPDVAYRNERFALDNVGPTFRVAYPGRVAGRPIGPGNLDLVVTASEPLAGVPVIAIDRPGSEQIGPVVMGSAQPLTFTYGVLVADGAARLDGTARVALAGTDVAGNPGTVVTEGETFVIDTGAPVVTSIVRTGAGALTRGPAMAFNVTLSEPVTGVAIPTFAVDAGPGVTGTPPVIGAVSGRGDTWSVIVSAPGAVADAGTDATATIGLRVVPLGVPVSNARGTALLDPVVYGPNERYRLDNVAPIFTLTSSGPAGAPHGIGDVTITARPNEPLSANPVVSVDQAGIADAPSLPTIGIGTYDATWTIQKATGTRPGVDAWVDGTARIGVLGTDLAGNVGSAVVGGSTIEVATSGVFVTGITRSGGAPALVNAGPIRFTVTFSEPVNGDVAGTFAVDPGRAVTGRTPIVTTVSGSGDARVVEVDLTGMVADFGTDRGATLGLRVRAEPVRVSGASGAVLASGVPNGPNERYELDNVGPGFRIAASAPGACAGPAAPGAACTEVSVTANESLRAAPRVRVVPSRGQPIDLTAADSLPATGSGAGVGVGPWSHLHRGAPAAGARALAEVDGIDLAGNPGRRILGSAIFATGAGASCPGNVDEVDGYERYLVELPTRDDTSPQVWVRHRSSGRYVYVTTPAEFWRYGIAADLSNVVKVPWGARVFGTYGPVSGDDLFWVRKDTPSGITTSYPEVPWPNTEALHRAFAERRLVPYGVTGYAVLREQLVPLGGDPGYGPGTDDCPGDGALAASNRRPVAPRYRGPVDDWDRYLVQLPSARDTNPQIWVRYRKTGEYHFVDGPREFDRYGVLPDLSNLVFVPWGSAVFRAAGPLYDDEEAFWIRNDLTPGVKRDYPQVPLSTTGALGRAFAERRLVPAGVTGWAVLKEQKLLP